MTTLVCERCKKEIAPGALVEFITALDEHGELPRIMLDEDTLVVHKDCPE